jgi:UDP-2,3-diacylglucosamine hydrolase
MIQAVFISDLHLSPDEPEITRRFLAWAERVSTRTKTVYILGDFFHAWAGDDTDEPWLKPILEALLGLSKQGISVYFMPGNRDFLLGAHWARLAGMQMLTEPALITLGEQRVMLVHGDRYCTEDKAHQWFRCLTRNPLFIHLFLSMPRRWREDVVARVRRRSQAHQSMDFSKMDVVTSVLVRHAKRHQADVVIHGHTHKPTKQTHDDQGFVFQHIILSDWEDKPPILCYDRSKGFYFDLEFFEDSL